MARIGGVELPDNKRVLHALTSIYGVGVSKSKTILVKAEIEPTLRMKDLSEDQLSKIRVIIENEEQTEGELRRKIGMDIKRLQDIQAYRGLRHRKGLPVRGQRTKTNSRTRKGPRKAPVAGKKIATKK